MKSVRTELESLAGEPEQRILLFSCSNLDSIPRRGNVLCNDGADGRGFRRALALLLHPTDRAAKAVATRALQQNFKRSRFLHPYAPHRVGAARKSSKSHFVR